jgi:hypothetical protein
VSAVVFVGVKTYFASPPEDVIRAASPFLPPKIVDLCCVDIKNNWRAEISQLLGRLT